MLQEKTSRTIKPSLVEGERGYHEKISDSELERLLLNGGDIDSCEVVPGIDVYEYHPWELVTKFGGFRPRYFLLSVTQQDHEGRMQKRRKTIERKTKDGFSWKQSGPTHGPGNQVIDTRYLNYMLERGHPSDLPHVQEYRKYNLEKEARKLDKNAKKMRGPKCRWKMHEITLRHSVGRRTRNVILMIFQEQDGKPVWPQSGQKDQSEDKTQLEKSIPVSTPSGDNEIVHDSCVGPDSLRLLENIDLDLCCCTDLQTPDIHNDVGEGIENTTIMKYFGHIDPLEWESQKLDEFESLPYLSNFDRTLWV